MSWEYRGQKSNSDASVTIHMLYCLRNQENKRGEHAVKKEG